MDESLIRNLSFAMHIMLSLGIELAIPLLADPEMAVSTSSRPPPDVNVTHLSNHGSHTHDRTYVFLDYGDVGQEARSILGMSVCESSNARSLRFPCAGFAFPFLSYCFLVLPFPPASCPRSILHYRPESDTFIHWKVKSTDCQFQVLPMTGASFI